jgi:hypothetical protein
LHQLVSKQLHGPARLALWRRAASGRNQEGFLFVVELAPATRPGCFGEGTLEIAFDKALAGAFDRRTANMKDISNCLVAGTVSGLQQNMGAVEFTGGDGTFLNQVEQRRTLCLG